MRILSHTAIVIVFTIFLLAGASAEQQSTPKYLPEGGVDGAAMIGAPPAVGSPEFETQMAIVLWLQQTRTPEQVIFVETTLNLNRFAPIIGAELLDVDGTVLRQTLAAIINEVRTDYDAIKARYDLPRPFVVNDKVKPAINARAVASYPSGHAIRAVVYARILGVIFPEKKDDLMELALQIGYGRVIAGVHYPIDVIAGQVLGKLYADVIVESDTFNEAITKIRPQ
ncbi:MAG: phosphatase PAP2 family protein [Thermodesulfobacteriota bacterium]